MLFFQFFDDNDEAQGGNEEVEIEGGDEDVEDLMDIEEDLEVYEDNDTLEDEFDNLFGWRVPNMTQLFSYYRFVIIAYLFPLKPILVNIILNLKTSFNGPESYNTVSCLIAIFRHISGDKIKWVPENMYTFSISKKNILKSNSLISLGRQT